MSTISNESSGEMRQSRITQRAKDLLLESGNCAQTSFAILCQEHDLDRRFCAQFEAENEGTTCSAI